MANQQRGDVVLTPFRHSDGKSGGVRPAVVVQDDDLNTGLQQWILAMVSTNLTRSNHSCRVLLHAGTPEGLQAGLLADSVIMTDNLTTAHESTIIRTIGSLSAETQQAVEAALRHTLGLAE